MTIGSRYHDPPAFLSGSDPLTVTWSCVDPATDNLVLKVPPSAVQGSIMGGAEDGLDNAMGGAEDSLDNAMGGLWKMRHDAGRVRLACEAWGGAGAGGRGRGAEGDLGGAVLRGGGVWSRMVHMAVLR